VSTRFLALREFPDTFVYPKDNYMASLILNLQYQFKMSAYIGHIHFDGVKTLLSDLEEHKNLSIQNFLGSSGNTEDAEI
jgi:hypothetical protein